jgi:hypothetical protein
LVEHIQSQVTTESLFSTGDHVVQSGRTCGTVVADGASFDVPEVQVWEVLDGKVVDFRAYIDTPAMLRRSAAEHFGTRCGVVQIVPARARAALRRAGRRRDWTRSWCP